MRTMTPLCPSGHMTFHGSQGSTYHEAEHVVSMDLGRRPRPTIGRDYVGFSRSTGLSNMAFLSRDGRGPSMKRFMQSAQHPKLVHQMRERQLLERRLLEVERVAVATWLPVITALGILSDTTGFDVISWRDAAEAIAAGRAVQLDGNGEPLDVPPASSGSAATPQQLHGGRAPFFTVQPRKPVPVRKPAPRKSLLGKALLRSSHGVQSLQRSMPPLTPRQELSERIAALKERYPDPAGALQADRTKEDGILWARGGIFGAIGVGGRDWDTCKRGEFLCENVLQVYIHRVMRVYDQRIRDEACSRDVAVYSTYFFTSLFGNGMSSGITFTESLRHQLVACDLGFTLSRQTAMRLRLAQLFECKVPTLLFPINVPNLHWALLEVLIAERTITYIDSKLGCGSAIQVLGHDWPVGICMAIREVLTIAYRETLPPPSPGQQADDGRVQQFKDSWTLVPTSPCPQQHFHECGARMCFNIEAKVFGQDLPPCESIEDSRLRLLKVTTGEVLPGEVPPSVRITGGGGGHMPGAVHRTNSFHWRDDDTGTLPTGTAIYVWGANLGNYSTRPGRLIGGEGMAGDNGPTSGLGHPRFIGVPTTTAAGGTPGHVAAVATEVLLRVEKLLLAGADVYLPEGRAAGSTGLGDGLARGQMSVSEWQAIQSALSVGLARIFAGSANLQHDAQSGEWHDPGDDDTATDDPDGNDPE